jgi:hypothetical protein
MIKILKYIRGSMLPLFLLWKLPDFATISMLSEKPPLIGEDKEVVYVNIQINVTFLY